MTALYKEYFKHLMLAFLFLGINLSYGREYLVNSSSELNSLSLQAGDIVIWEDGVYSEGGSIRVTDNGSSNSPILIKAETPGGVSFTGGMTVDIGGNYVTLEGFHWKGGDGAANHIEFRSGTQYAEYSTLRNCVVDNLTPSGTDKHRWVVMFGEHNTVEHCSFLNKRSPGALILVELAYNNFDPVEHTIQNNYFFNYEHRTPGETHSGDSETIRVGTSSYQNKNANCLISNNYFKACDGENEIITNKSANNTYTHNTFRNCLGSLVLRHGANAWVEGNYFLGEEKESSGGIRISDSYHTVINNYFQDLRNDGSSWNNAITLVGGSDESGGTANGYQKVDDVLIAHNTIYNCDGPLFYNDREAHDPTGMFAYNLVLSDRTTLVGGDIAGTGQGMNYLGNMMGGSTIGINNSGITDITIPFEQNGEIYVPTATSQVANAAGSEYDSIVTADIVGRLRSSGSSDIGSHEVSGAVGSSQYFPLTDDDVSSKVGACFVAASGASLGSCSDIGNYLTVSQPSTLSADATTGSLTISSSQEWTISHDASWLSFDTVSGSGNIVVDFSADGNTNTSSRSALLTIASDSITRTVTLSQEGYTAPVAVTGINVTPEDITISQDSTFMINATVSPADASNQNITFSSLNSSIATVTSGGEVTGINAGTTQISVTSEDGAFTSNVAVTVIEASSTVNVALNALVIGQEDQAHNPLQNLTDGDTSSRYAVEGYPKSVIIDLGAVYNLERSELVTYGARSYQYSVAVSNNLSGSFTTVSDKSNNTNGGSPTSPLEDFYSTSARYIQLTVTGIYSGYTGSWISLNEFNVYGRLATSAPSDQDGDGVPDDEDAFPNDSSETQDSDGDGTGDNADAFPNDSSETQDSDGDGIGDNADEDSTPATNIALNALVIGQEDQAHNPLSNLTDADTSSRYSVENFPKSVIVDLGSIYDLERSELITFGSRSYQYTIAVSNSLDGSFTTVSDKSDNTNGGSIESPLEDVYETSARYVQITISGIHSGYTGSWISLMDFKVYGRPTTSDPLLDSDGDGVPDDEDAFPNDSSETVDSDGDGTGDNADEFPNDSSETVDSDGDGTGDNADEFPNDSSETVDSDGDGTGDNADEFPNDSSETVDSDGDGTGDNADEFPNDSSETVDSDGDGTGDNADEFPNDSSETVDSDGDGTGDNADEFPNDSSETVDSDGDGTGDNADEFPNDSSETVDSDGDGVGDNADEFPNDPTRSGFDTLVEYQVMEDSHVRGGVYADINYGSTTAIQLKTSSRDKFKRYAYFKFNLEEGIGEEALFIFSVVRASLDSSSHQLYAVSSDWDESDITWNSQPELGELLTTFEILSSDVGNDIAIDVSDYVQSFEDDADISFVIVQESNQSLIRVSSKESNNGARLEVIQR